MAHGDCKAAIEYLKKELDLEPEDTDVLLSMGSMLLSLGDADTALQCFLQSLDADENNAQVYYYLGLAAVMRQELANAKDFFESALKLDPQSPAILRDMAQLHLLLGDTETALHHAAKAVQCSGGDPEIAKHYRRIRFKHLVCRIRGKLDITSNS